MEVNNIGRRCLVTGGTRGIGRAIANALADSGGSVLITGTGETKPSDEEFARLDYASLDLASDASLASFCEILNDYPPFDIIVNNAGINIIERFSDLSVENFDLVQDVNIRAVARISRAALTRDYHSTRHVINIASIWSVISKEGRVSYATSKAALVGFTRSLAVDLAPSNIIVNAISPGFTDTELTRASLSDQEIAALSEKIPSGRMASVEEIADVALFLSSLSNNYIIGQNIIVDGGFSIV